MSNIKNESEWTYLPLSEERIVAQQLKNRSRQDAAYRARQLSASCFESGGELKVAEELLCTYVDLERQIAACSFPSDQQELLDRQMDGYSLRDLSEMKSEAYEKVERDFRNMVARIARQSRSQWEKAYSKKYAE